MKLYYRSGVLWNQIYFLIVSIVYLFVISSIGNSTSPFKFSNLESFLVSHKAIVIFAIISAIFIYLSRKVSKAFFLSFGLTCLLYSFYTMILHFSKISIILASGYTVVLYYFYQILSNELSLAYRNSIYSKREVFSPVLKKIPLTLTAGDDQELKAYILNWDESSCYLKVISGELDEKNIKYRVNSELKGYKLEDIGHLGTLSIGDNEIGLRFEEENSTYGWNHFSGIMEMLGFKMEYLK